MYALTELEVFVDVKISSLSLQLSILISKASRFRQFGRIECLNPKMSPFIIASSPMLLKLSCRWIMLPESLFGINCEGIAPKVKRLLTHSEVEPFNVSEQTSQFEDISRLLRPEVITIEIVGGEMFKCIAGHRIS
ncbi:MAG: hypothetical protein ACTS8U_00045 [Arsenophonus sp. ET-DL9-MAG3]